MNLGGTQSGVNSTTVHKSSIQHRSRIMDLSVCQLLLDIIVSIIQLYTL